jgi:glycosyltransferase involved in cell wall biosynthesis
LKILYIINQLDCGGAEQQLVALCEKLARLGHKLHVISIYDQLELKPRLTDIRVPVVVAHKHGKFDVTLVWRLRQFIKHIKPDLVHAYLPASSLFAGMTKWLGVDVPVIQAERSVNTWRTPMRIWLDNVVRRRVAAITCNANAIKQHLVRTERVPEDRIVTIYNGLASKRRTPPASADIQRAREQLAAPAGSFVLACLANFVPEKAHGVLLQAVALARRKSMRVRLVLIGKGDLEPQTRQMVCELGLADSTRIINDSKNPLPLLCASHAAILTSSIEGCSNAVLEAMAMGLPVIASDAGGNGELVIDGLGGTLCPVGDIDAFGRAILKLASNKLWRYKMGVYNRKRIADEFTDDKMVERTTALYHRLLNDAGSGSRPAETARVELN